MKDIRVVVIGHTGFIGQEIFRQLVNKVSDLEGYSTADFDLSDSTSIIQLGPRLTTDTILIVAAALNREKGDTIEIMQKHIGMIANLAKVLELYPSTKCVYLSSADVYGRPEELPITEKTPVNPQSFYGIAKFTCEKILQKVANDKKFSLLILRYNGIFGPGQKNTGYGPNNFIKSAIQEGKVRIWGDGSEKRDAVYVFDLARLIVDLSLGQAEGIFNVATGKSVSFEDIVNTLGKISHGPFQVIVKERTSPALDQKFKITKLKKYLPRLRFTPFEKALKATYQFYKEKAEQGELFVYL
ncbi:SDR family oxidoreductase [Candidatus Daviesbacteria bacterium]|nr:SDR family oxidoreductase [Candidatus Daviesbacteria bacterium]